MCETERSKDKAEMHSRLGPSILSAARRRQNQSGASFGKRTLTVPLDM